MPPMGRAVDFTPKPPPPGLGLGDPAPEHRNEAPEDATPPLASVQKAEEDEASSAMDVAADRATATSAED